MSEHNYEGESSERSFDESEYERFQADLNEELEHDERRRAVTEEIKYVFGCWCWKPSEISDFLKTKRRLLGIRFRPKGFGVHTKSRVKLVWKHARNFDLAVDHFEVFEVYPDIGESDIEYGVHT